MTDETPNTLSLLTPEDIHPTVEDFPFVCLLYIGDLLDELNRRAHSYRIISDDTHDFQQRALLDFTQQIKADGRTFLPLATVDAIEPIYFEVRDVQA